jgi:UDP-N-acetylmuramate: L-alanyl-gamma-D-glutamyl-meso-diaminopimelate ligase
MIARTAGSMVFDNIKKVHFIGIAGKGMSATALLLRQLGCKISGSDDGFYPPVSDYLVRAGIPFSQGYRKEHIPPDADIIVIGKNANLIPEKNAEVRAAFASGKPVRSFPDILEELIEGTDTIVVAGSYGKSTCTALLAWCLAHAGKDPSYFIGEVTNGFDAYAHLGKGGVFVLEGDEYPSANWDDRSKFLHYRPKNILLTSATHDHVNIFPTHAEYLAPFRALLSILPPDGLLIANNTEPYARALAQNCTGKAIFYALEGATWHADQINYGNTTGFDLMREKDMIAPLATSLLGAHNIENIVGVAAMLLEKKLLTPKELAAGIASFQGVKRRLDRKSDKTSIPIFEGFGSSYEKARSAISAIQLHFPGQRLIVVFEPHTFSWRNRGALAWYDDVFAGAAKVFIYEPAAQGAGSHAQLSQAEIVARVKKAGFDAEAVGEPAAALANIDRSLDKNDVILLLTSGNLGGLIETIPRLAERKFPLR